MRLSKKALSSEESKERALRKYRRRAQERQAMRERCDTFGAVFYKLREAHGVSLGNMAKQLGFDKSYICLVQNNKKPPFKKERCKKAAEFLQLDESERAEFFDAAASASNGDRPVAYDIEDYLFANPDSLRFLRLAKTHNLPNSFWLSLIDSNTKMGY